MHSISYSLTLVIDGEPPSQADKKTSKLEQVFTSLQVNFQLLLFCWCVRGLCLRGGGECFQFLTRGSFKISYFESSYYPPFKPKTAIKTVVFTEYIRMRNTNISETLQQSVLFLFLFFEIPQSCFRQTKHLKNQRSNEKQEDVTSYSACLRSSALLTEVLPITLAY